MCIRDRLLLVNTTHRETLALDKWDSRAASDLPFVIYLDPETKKLNLYPLVACPWAAERRYDRSGPWTGFRSLLA